MLQRSEKAETLTAMLCRAFLSPLSSCHSQSTGAMPPQDIVSEAIWVLQGKLDVLKSELDKKKGQTAEVEVDEGFKNSKSMNW